MNHYNKIIFNTVYWIIIPLAGLSIVLVHISIFNHDNLKLDYQGIIYYLNYFTTLQPLLGLAITLIIAKIALKNWELAVINNQEKNYQDTYKDWVIDMERGALHFDNDVMNAFD